MVILKKLGRVLLGTYSLADFCDTAHLGIVYVHRARSLCISILLGLQCKTHTHTINIYFSTRFGYLFFLEKLL